jgi:hypothetical protein
MQRDPDSDAFGKFQEDQAGGAKKRATAVKKKATVTKQKATVAKKKVIKKK